MKSVIWTTLAAALLVAATACDDATTATEGPYTLTFVGDSSFVSPHAGMSIRIGLVGPGGDVLGTQTGTVAESGDPGFAFTFTHALEHGQSYEVHYWIDSNFGGGAPGYCDAKAIDHQWNEAVGPARGDLEIIVDHDAANTERVCPTFANNLTFDGDASFQNTHGEQTAHMALVRPSDGVVLVRDSGTVSSSEDPSFSFRFSAALLPNTAYQVHLWMDSNFGGGTEGVCDSPETDHQWSVNVDPGTDDVHITYQHDPGATTDVCASF